MTADISKFGLNFIVGLQGTVLAEEEEKLLSLLRPAGVILFAKNVDTKREDWPEQVAALLRAAQKASGRERFFAAVDHEGGKVHRFPEPVTRFPPAFCWQQAGFEVGQAMGRELRALSFNLDFAPVLDIWSEDLNTVIGRRAFGKCAAEVSTAALAFRRGLEAEGVLSCGKHFPGHGATIADSHYELPVLQKALPDMEESDLSPFRDYIADGGRMIMTAHVNYPLLDPENPATLSESIVSGILRRRLGFEGVVITDDLEMGALQGLTLADRAVRALNAGADILLEGYPAQAPAAARAVEMAQGIGIALNERVLGWSTVNAAQARIEQLFCYLNSLGPKKDAGIGILGCEEHRALSRKFTEERLV